MEERLAQGEMMNLRVKLGSEVTTDPTYSELRSPADSFISGFLSDTNGHPRSAFPAHPCLIHLRSMSYTPIYFQCNLSLWVTY